ncbi:PilT/PilU family type 4a pilus ATPase [Verrucomicrobiaceae bacterium R5-34]|uniref:PilT/PilU family type 4a pilus ATPase n=1 Tax=Oceaniferula flava TaxID=2800421 RepID=A0AAE2VAN4_9BACT|nr:PilT/PilU family type 4a pilus ATPase [Oceaniferula flavus]MBK1829263.1 PilT/PilU family type 4a pilus ATPase [Verrucomicrobiaceae bacterium R5-34]MBK1853500.1 PilT/PilU family type 4a pilus ATPase [Oceaniferula flavus]MBM1134805.1 PilT/PilU family type 4a pilus ATPase [Oceaniferula flavus]
MSEVKKITDYLRVTVELEGSDLHLTSGAPPAARVDGQLKPLEEFCLNDEVCKQLIMDTLTEAQRTELEQNWELDYAIHVDNVGRFRGNVHYIRGHIEASFRYIPTEIPDLATLGHYPVIEQICQLRRGLVLLTGVTGSGKTTTMASMIKRISETRSGVIITVEDPIEFVYEHRSCLVKQREVGSDTKSFSGALRQALRQDPDVIVVSELRDLETIRIALTAAETGHLVIATLHTVDAPQSVDRLVDVFPPDQQQQIIAQLANVCEAIVSQRLLMRPDGQGRALATEVMKMNHGLRTCIRERKIEQMVGLMEIGQGEGMHTIDESLAHLLQTGQIDLQEALYNCRDRKRFEPNK